MEWYIWILPGWILFWLFLSFLEWFVAFYKRRKRRINAAIAHKKWLEKEEPLNRATKGYPKDWDRRRWEVFIRAKGKCAECGCNPGVSFVDYLSLYGVHIHHIKPISQGGSHSFENLELLCEDCHIQKHPESIILIMNKNRRHLYLGNDATLKKARKIWQCELCEKQINPGEFYYGGNYDKICERCCESNNY